MSSYIIPLNRLKVEILLETVEAFVDNKKLLHVPDKGGSVVGLPLTADALHKLLEILRQTGDESQDVEIHLDSVGKETTVKIGVDHAVIEYVVNLEEFDEQ